MHLADTLSSGLEDDEPEEAAPEDPAERPKPGNLKPVDSVITTPLWQKGALAAIVVALLIFVLRQRRRSVSVTDEKNIA